MSPPSLGEGSEIGGYRIESLFGRGGMGSVFGKASTLAGGGRGPAACLLSRPSGKAVRLTIGDGAGHGEYLGTQGSTDSGGASMPEGTWFRTPRRTILCSSSGRGITCLDLLRSYEGFTIGDYRVRLEKGGSTVGLH